MDRIVNEVRLGRLPRVFPLLFSVIFLLLALFNNLDAVLIGFAIGAAILALVLLKIPIVYFSNGANEVVFKLNGVMRTFRKEQIKHVRALGSMMDASNGLSYDTQFAVRFAQGAKLDSVFLENPGVLKWEKNSGDTEEITVTFRVPFAVIEYGNSKSAEKGSSAEKGEKGAFDKS